MTKRRPSPALGRHQYADNLVAGGKTMPKLNGPSTSINGNSELKMNGNRSMLIHSRQ